MTECKKLAVTITTQSVDVLSDQRGSLVGRGLVAIQNSKHLALTKYTCAISAEEQYRTGLMYDCGVGATQDYELALKWYRLAAEQGHAGAQFNLGAMYQFEEGVPQDYEEALKWYRLSAEQEDAYAQVNLGAMYCNGEGVLQDYQEAVRWFRKAADQGDADGQFNLGVMYDNGTGVRQRKAQAIKLYRLAAAQGHAEAQNILKLWYEETESVVQHLLQSFPVISTKGGRFHVMREGVRTLITRPKAKPTYLDEPASFIDMVVLNLQKAKSFYADGAEDKPDCFSNDGVVPDAGAQNPQCSTCALCPHNTWGSGENVKGEAIKGKACPDVLRLAVAFPANMDDAFLLSVPSSSLKNFAEMSKWLTSKRIPVNCAVIRISFDLEKAGVMEFVAIGKLDHDIYAKAKAMMNSPLVLSIVGKSDSSATYTDGFSLNLVAEWFASKEPM